MAAPTRRAIRRGDRPSRPRRPIAAARAGRTARVGRRTSTPRPLGVTDARDDRTERPSWALVVWRGALVTAVTAVTLWIFAAVLGDFSIDRPRDALLAGLGLGLVGAVVWPALAFVVVPISVLTLGLGAIVLEAIVVGIVLDALPGVQLEGFWTAFIVAIGLAAVTTIVSTALALDDDAWFDQQTARRARRRKGAASSSDVPGVVFLQLDGVAMAVLERALRSGDVPNLHRWIRDGTHR